MAVTLDAQDWTRRIRAMAEPHPDVHDEELRRAAALTATLSIIALPPVALTIVAAPPLIEPGTPYFGSALVQSGIVVLTFLVGSYLLARSRWPRVGVHLLAWGVFAATWCLIILGNGTPWEGGADFLVVGAALGALTLPLWASTTAWLANLIGFVSFLAFKATFDDTFEIQDRAVTVILLTVLPGLLIAGQNVRDRLHETVTQQGQRLRQGGEEFAALVEASFRREAALELETSLASSALKEAERLDEVNRFKTTFLNMVAHDLNNVLTPLKLNARIVSDQLAKHGETNLKPAASLTHSVNRIAAFLADLLDASRLQSRQLQLVMQPFDLARLVAQACDTLEPGATADQLHFSYDVPPTAAIVGDRGRLEQVFTNLLSNAFKFTPPDGSIMVTLTPEIGGFHLAVADTGRGIPPEAASSLFQPFSRLGPVPQGKHSGTGLGLFIAKGIVEQHGGRIWFESPGADKGTTFHVALPSTPPPTTTQQGVAGENPPGPTVQGAPKNPATASQAASGPV